MEYVTLRGGMRLPAIGFGPGGAGYVPNVKPGRRSLFRRAWNKLVTRQLVRLHYVRAVSSAISQGFRLIDYSAAYGDGKLIGHAIRKSGVKREDLILTTRVSNGAQFTGKIEDEFFAQLRNFGTDYVDILMFHWPVTGCYADTWLKMLELQEKGYCRVLGAANCHAHHLEELEKASSVLPEIDQFEVHPLFTQKELRDYCRAKGIQVESYTPVARFDDRLMRLPVLRKIAEKYSRTVTQVVLCWHIQSGLVPVVRTLNPSHQKENIDVFGFSLTDEEMSAIDSVNINARVRYDPDNCDFTIL